MPLVQSLTREQKPLSGIALGGIGAGSIELRHDGIFRNWSIFNNLPRSYGPFCPLPEDQMLFFLLRVEVEGEEPFLKILQIPEGYYVGSIPNHQSCFPWLTGIERIEAEFSFPFAQLRFSDPDLPFTIDLNAWSPFIPHDLAASTLPVACFDFTLRATSNRKVHLLLLGTLRHAVAYDLPDRLYQTHLAKTKDGIVAQLSCGNVPANHPTVGTMALTSLHPKSSHYLGWEHRHWYYERLIENRDLINLDDTAGRNSPDPVTGVPRADPRHFSSLGIAHTFSKKDQSLRHSFALTWHFPNDRAVDGSPQGRYYARSYQDATEVARHFARVRTDLLARTSAFHHALYDSTLPEFVLDQINSHLNTFAASSTLSAHGEFGIREGLTPERSWGPLATVDVSLYGLIAVQSLFPDLAISGARCWAKLQAPNGIVPHGLSGAFHLGDASEHKVPRIDLAPQFVILALRSAFWANDSTLLAEFYPHCRAAIEYTLRERDPDHDGMPDAENRQHMCTYDNFAMPGVASFIASLWMSALSHLIEAARLLDHTDDVARYEAILSDCRRIFEERLWNGKYYRLSSTAPGDSGGPSDGCLTDQLIGEWCNLLTAFAPNIPSARFGKVLPEIVRRNTRRIGLINCSWPGDPNGRHPVPDDCWDDQHNVRWTGVELAFAAFLLHTGHDDLALPIIAAVDRAYRQSGRYFDHHEFGAHYYRPMSSWAILHGHLGVGHRNGIYSFAPPSSDRARGLFSAGLGLVHADLKASETKTTLKLLPITGTFRPSGLELGLPFSQVKKLALTRNDKALITDRDFTITAIPNSVALSFPKPPTLKPGDTLELRLHA
ncbi:MAG: GH116 family glycosyl hydrolase [Verrucomicrobiia bacterium]